MHHCTRKEIESRDSFPLPQHKSHYLLKIRRLKLEEPCTRISTVKLNTIRGFSQNGEMKEKTRYFLKSAQFTNDDDGAALCLRESKTDI
ncbi:hypothetical protein CEXT_365521 [Caerostris extrusa]|uniref:Uncharacterized protein n=1 Tax=Caerostris extrusa TaxID=172846 RepID=A0AAV4UYG7_CAEEX|nr:hypothetical protein CEXT_365521 [Caerostris extrusa]